MKKPIIAVLIVALVGAGLVYVFMISNDNKTVGNQTASSDADNSPKTTGMKACELLTLDDAKNLIGDSATLSEGSGDSNLATTDEVNVDNCTYSADGTTLGDLKQITIQRHYGNKDQVVQAYEANKRAFPGDELPGLGDKAYYATEAEHVNAVKGNYWVFIFGGSINAGDEANKEQNLKAMNIVLEKI